MTEVDQSEAMCDPTMSKNGLTCQSKFLRKFLRVALSKDLCIILLLCVNDDVTGLVKLMMLHGLVKL